MRICNFISKRAKSKKFCIFEKVYRIYNFSSNFDLSFLELIVLIASSSMWSKKCKFSKIACFSFNYNAFFFSFFFFLWKATSMNKVIYFSLWKGIKILKFHVQNVFGSIHIIIILHPVLIDYFLCLYSFIHFASHWL